MIFLGALILVCCIVQILMTKDERNAVCSFFIFLLSFVLGTVFTANVEPAAIDVYRGSTKLQITETVIDSNIVKKDSTVIFKNEKDYEKGI